MAKKPTEINFNKATTSKSETLENSLYEILISYRDIFEDSRGNIIVETGTTEDNTTYYTVEIKQLDAKHTSNWRH